MATRQQNQSNFAVSMSSTLNRCQGRDGTRVGGLNARDLSSAQIPEPPRARIMIARSGWTSAIPASAVGTYFGLPTNTESQILLNKIGEPLANQRAIVDDVHLGLLCRHDARSKGSKQLTIVPVVPRLRILSFPPISWAR